VKKIGLPVAWANSFLPGRRGSVLDRHPLVQGNAAMYPAGQLSQNKIAGFPYVDFSWKHRHDLSRFL